MLIIAFVKYMYNVKNYLEIVFITYTLVQYLV